VKKFLVLAVAPLALLAQMIATRGTVRTSGSFNTPSQASFHVITPAVTSFNVAYVSGMACISNSGTVVGTPSGSPPTCSSGYLSMGYQGGDLVNGVAVWPPWEVAGDAPVNNAYLLMYAGGTTGAAFQTPGNWLLKNLNADVSGCPSSSQSCPWGFNAGVLVGQNYYLVPGATCAPYCEFTMVSTAGSGTPSTWTYSYQPQSVTSYSGGVTGFYDAGHGYVCFVPALYGGHVYYVCHNAALDSTGLSASGWFSQDLTACSGYPGTANYNGSAYDGNRFVYTDPATGTPSSTILGIIDTSASFGCGQWATFDLSKLGTSGYPRVTGGGNPAQLAGADGLVVGLQGSTASGAAWLYVGGWAPYKVGTTGTLVMSSTIARVQVGTYSGGMFYGQGAAGGPPSISSSGATWEVYDVGAAAQSNPAFTAAGFNTSPGAYYASGTRQGQRMVAAWQLGWFNPATHMVILNASDGKYELELDPTKHLWDPTGWYLAGVTDASLVANEYGGPAVLGGWGGTTIYPSTPTANNLLQVGGL